MAAGTHRGGAALLAGPAASSPPVGLSGRLVGRQLDLYAMRPWIVKTEMVKADLNNRVLEVTNLPSIGRTRSVRGPVREPGRGPPTRRPGDAPAVRSVPRHPPEDRLGPDSAHRRADAHSAWTDGALSPRALSPEYPWRQKRRPTWQDLQPRAPSNVVSISSLSNEKTCLAASAGSRHGRLW